MILMDTILLLRYTARNYRRFKINIYRIFIYLSSCFRKRWIMFPNTNTQFMYPTRIPFEESTIYSKINIKLPNMNNYPKFNVRIFYERWILFYVKAK